MEYISLSKYDIPDLMFPIMFSVMEVVANKEDNEPQVPSCKCEVIATKV
jgi:hypothetical protein